MTYEVEWLASAEQELAAIWLGSSDRQAITAASYALDQRLRLDPLNSGESRLGNRRIDFEKPLAILFEVLQAQRLVQVIFVWRY